MDLDEISNVNTIVKVNDYETVFLPAGKTVRDMAKWYEKEYGEKLNLDDIEEVDYKDGFWSSDIPKEVKEKLDNEENYKYEERDQFFLDKDGKVKEGTVEIIYGDAYIYRLFETEAKENNDNEIFVLCSTEF